MGYCTITDVQALNPKRTYDYSSQPTQAQVESLIDQVAIEIDAALMVKGYEAPATTPTGWVNFLKVVNAYGAAALAEYAMFPESSGKGETTYATVLDKKYRDWMDKIENGKITPSSLLTAQVASNYTEDSDRDNYPEPVFRKDSTDLEF